MKNFDKGPFEVGQKLLHCAGTKVQTVTFVSLGPRVGKAAGSDMVTKNPETAIVKDRHGNLITANVTDLKPLPPN